MTNKNLNNHAKNIPQKKLPIGIQTFADIRNENFYYVDKTKHILQLVEYRYIFLSRPRRFGKSLTLDTIAELFTGNKELFTGLYAEANWDWDTTYPVIRLGFAEGIMGDKQALYSEIHSQLSINEQKYAIANTVTNTVTNTTEKDLSISNRFRQLIRTLYEKYHQKVVILIDEYDKPILDNLTKPDIALIMRDGLRDLYSVIKGQDAHIRFAMLTGVSKFSKVNLFSGLNNLLDITIDEKFSALCGYTQQELETVFAPELQGVDLAQLKTWYNGYNWTGESVYNPFDILLYLNAKVFRPYWFETGTPTFLIDKMVDDGVASYEINQQIASESILSSFDVGDISPIALMFQTGYLTIKQMLPTMALPRYQLGYPNLEVQYSLNQVLLHRYIGQAGLAEKYSQKLIDLLFVNDFDGIHELINAFFSSIPHDWHRNNNIAHFEGYWASVFYAYFASLGLQVVVEDSTNRGRMDMTVDFNECIYIFEFKVIEQSKKPNSALEQIKDKGYADKYRMQGKAIYLIGVEFSETSREVADFVVEEVV
ncbi:ATP-binding protein [Psychrobacter sp. I-STPA6b]|uniref:ATP-binding protein n=1 Tax=Psychrobacter sp. I-STPA6b TaxID=2585718 RepID=UPI001D0CA16F|nr:ATP-binding protein [Psychrobacter sp. I-STPA6b]